MTPNIEVMIGSAIKFGKPMITLRDTETNKLLDHLSLLDKWKHLEPKHVINHDTGTSKIYLRLPRQNNEVGQVYRIPMDFLEFHENNDGDIKVYLLFEEPIVSQHLKSIVCNTSGEMIECESKDYCYHYKVIFFYKCKTNSCRF